MKQIKNRYTGEVIFESPCSTMRETIIKAVENGSNLSCADLRGADLRGSNLRGSNLCDANLSDADLRGSNLRGADLCDANLSDADLCNANLINANLSYADLCDANLSDADLIDANLIDADLCNANLINANLIDANLCNADLRGSNLRGADLRGANLRGADLIDANLSGSNLCEFRSDFISEVLNLPNELEFLRAAIIEGKIDGSTYTGECACLAGTMAKAKGQVIEYSGQKIKNGRTFTAEASSPREKFFMAIKKGDTPETNPASKIALEWTDEAIAIRDNIRVGFVSKK